VANPSSSFRAGRTGKLDIRNTPVSGEPDALEEYEKALKSFQTYVGDPIALIDGTLAKHPEFILGHLFRAIAYCLTSERRHLAAAQSSLFAAQKLLATANQREQLLYTAIEQLVAGQWHAACLAFDHVLQQYPRDALALQTAHLMDFFRGDALNLRNRLGRVLPEWDENMPGYSYLLGMYAFGLEECNQYADAEKYALRALELNPVDAWSVHAAVHVMEMCGRAEEGIRFLQDRESSWAPDNGFSFHNWWHLGLMYLEQGDDAKVLDIFDRHIFTGADDCVVLVDVTSMLWRLHLLDVDLGSRFEQLANVWSQKLDEEAGYYAFNDFHASLAFAATGAQQQLSQLGDQLLHAATSDDTSNAQMSANVGGPLVQAVSAYAAQQYDVAVELLLKTRDVAYGFGGSHAQRDIINLTLLSAASKQGNASLVRHLCNERKINKPNESMGERIIAAA